MDRMAVWGFLFIPAFAYISLTSSLGASAIWTGSLGGRWFGRVELQRLLAPLPSTAITLSRSAGRGALGGILGLASLSVVLAALFVFCLAAAFLGPGPVVLLGWLALVLGAAVVCVAWGAIIGSVIFSRRRYGWPAGVGVACALVILSNTLIGLFV
jgi:hypothetical protein